jgi:hypothetical protein
LRGRGIGGGGCNVGHIGQHRQSIGLRTRRVERGGGGGLRELRGPPKGEGGNIGRRRTE